MTSKPPSHLEPTDASPRAVALTAVALLIGLVIAGFVVAGTRHWFSPRGPGYRHSARWFKATFEQVEPVKQVEPGVPIRPKNLLDEVRQQESAQLSQYQWLGDSRDFAKIPIERAMEIVARKKGQIDLPAPTDSSGTGAGSPTEKP